MELRWKIAVVILVAILVYLLLPLKSMVTVSNTLKQPQEATIKVSLFGIIPVSGHASGKIAYLPKLPAKITIEQYGFHTIEDWTWLRPNIVPDADKYQYTLQERVFELDWSFTDPTGTIRLDPYFKITGNDVRGVPVNAVAKHGDELVWGWYTVKVFDVNFEDWFSIQGDLLQQNSSNLTSAALQPSGKFYLVDHMDYEFVLNFVKEYLLYSSEGYIDEEVRGYPKQYYLARHNRSMSFGDMVFLLCEAYTYEEPQEHYYVPVNKRYALVGDSMHAEDCYRNALYGYVPSSVASQTYAAILGHEDYWPWDEMLSQKKRVAELALTFDVESGRYIFADNLGTKAINPCQDEITSKAIPAEDRHLCDDPNAIGWYSPVRGEPDSEIPYPWSSGIYGFRIIRDLSLNTGIPTTLYLVTRELEIYDEYDPSLLEDTQAMVDAGIVEIGYHSKYHSHLGYAQHEHTAAELEAEKALLEAQFNTEIVGHRAPYLSILEANHVLHEETLQEEGFTYYSHGSWHEQVVLTHKGYTLFNTADQELSAFEWSANEYGYVLMLDHPWNLYYEEHEEGEDVYLVYDEERAQRFKAAIYEAISAGFIPVTAASLTMPER